MKLQEESKDEVENNQETDSEEKSPIRGRRDELLAMLLDTIKSNENLPSHVRFSFVTYADLEGALAVIYAILREPQG